VFFEKQPKLVKSAVLQLAKLIAKTGFNDVEFRNLCLVKKLVKGEYQFALIDLMECLQKEMRGDWDAVSMFAEVGFFGHAYQKRTGLDYLLFDEELIKEVNAIAIKEAVKPDKSLPETASNALKRRMETLQLRKDILTKLKQDPKIMKEITKFDLFMSECGIHLYGQVSSKELSDYISKKVATEILAIKTDRNIRLSNKLTIR